MFIRNGVPYSKSHTRDVLNAQLRDFFGGKNITVSLYRQLQSAIAARLGIGNILASHRLNLLPNPFHIQAGHTTATAQQHYGAQALNSIPIESVEWMYVASLEWQIEPLGLHQHLKKKTTETVSSVNWTLPMTSTLPSRAMEQPITSIQPVIPTNYDKFPESVEMRALLALKATYGKNARFKSIDQSRILCSMLNCDRDIVAILPTAGGKSSLIFCPTAVEPGCITVVIPSYKATLQDLERRCGDLSIPCSVWSSNQPIPMIGTGILFVSIEDASSKDFLASLLQIKHKVRRIIIDEAHEILYAADYRPCMLRIPEIRRSASSIPIVFMTATLPPQDVDKLEAMFRLKNLQIFRSSTVRPNIKYSFLKENNLEKQLKQTVGIARKVKYLGDEKGIAYCQSVSQCQLLIREFDKQGIPCVLYHGKMDNREEAVQEWIETEGCWIIATTAFGCGIDFPGIRDVIIFGSCYSFVELCQMSGRAGRDGNGANVYIVTSDQHFEYQPNLGSSERIAQYCLIRNWILDSKPSCIRQEMQRHVDLQSFSCFNYPDAKLCSYCEIIQTQILQTPNFNFETPEIPLIPPTTVPVSDTSSTEQNNSTTPLQSPTKNIDDTPSPKRGNLDYRRLIGMTAKKKIFPAEERPQRQISRDKDWEILIPNITSPQKQRDSMASPKNPAVQSPQKQTTLPSPTKNPCVSPQKQTTFSSPTKNPSVPSPKNQTGPPSTPSPTKKLGQSPTKPAALPSAPGIEKRKGGAELNAPKKQKENPQVSHPLIPHVTTSSAVTNNFRNYLVGSKSNFQRSAEDLEIEKMRQDQNLANFKLIMEKFRYHCLVCLVVKKWKCSHEIAKCPITKALCNRRRYCVKCVSLYHVVANCPQKRRNIEIEDTCYKCYLKNEIGTECFTHSKSGIQSICRSGFQDRMFAAFCVLWRYYPGMLPGSLPPSELCGALQEWAVTPNGSMNNMMVLFSFMLGLQVL